MSVTEAQYLDVLSRMLNHPKFYIVDPVNPLVGLTPANIFKMDFKGDTLFESFLMPTRTADMLCVTEIPESFSDHINDMLKNPEQLSKTLQMLVNFESASYSPEDDEEAFGMKFMNRESETAEGSMYLTKGGFMGIYRTYESINVKTKYYIACRSNSGVFGERFYEENIRDSDTIYFSDIVENERWATLKEHSELNCKRLLAAMALALGILDKMPNKHEKTYSRDEIMIYIKPHYSNSSFVDQNSTWFNGLSVATSSSSIFPMIVGNEKFGLTLAPANRKGFSPPMVLRQDFKCVEKTQMIKKDYENTFFHISQEGEIVKSEPECGYRALHSSETIIGVPVDKLVTLKPLYVVSNS